MKFPVTTLLLALVFPNLALAEDYKLISHNKAQLTIADADGQIRRTQDIVQLWSITLRATDHLLPKSIAIIKMLNEFNCASSQWRFVSMITYRKDESLISNDDAKDAPWRAVPPETQNSALKQFACGTQEYRKSQASLGPFPLQKIISSVYAGPWPVQ